jgi:hypothetical protein
MSIARRTQARFQHIAGMVGIILVTAIIALAAIYLLRGRGFGLWRLAHLGRAVLDARSVSSYSRGDFTSIVFLHQSTGRYLIRQGRVRQRLAETGYDFWDHDYNWPGLHRPDGSETGYSYNIPDNNTDPDGLAEIFAQRAYGLPLNAFSGLLQHEVIAFKSCFPVSHITNDKQLEQYKAYYRAMRDVMDQHPDKIFIIITPPPLNPVATNAETAARARAFAQWLASNDYLSGHPNMFTFDLFGYLAEDDPAAPDYNMLRRDYREGSDSHPNRVANETIGPLFAGFIIDAIQRYRPVYQSLVVHGEVGAW